MRPFPPSFVFSAYIFVISAHLSRTKSKVMKRPSGLLAIARMTWSASCVWNPTVEFKHIASILHCTNECN